jgi:hypothetical protein
LTIKPAALSSAEIKNYTVSQIDTTGDDGIYKMFEIEKADSYIISPGNRGGIMVINLEPNYANLDWNNVTYTSTPLYVPELGREVYMTFEQVAYNRNTQRYETVPYNDYLYEGGELKDIHVQKDVDGVIEKGIKLFPFSEINGDNTVYTGKIYIYVGLTYFVGLKDTITAKLSATTIDNDVEKIVEQDISLLTQYLPGVSVSYSGDKIKDGYLIQENTSGNAIDINLDIMRVTYIIVFNKTIQLEIQLIWIGDRGVCRFDVRLFKFPKQKASDCVVSQNTIKELFDFFLRCSI